jgi:multiple sugar transport system substrate-binding protein
MPGGLSTSKLGRQLFGHPVASPSTIGSGVGVHQVRCANADSQNAMFQAVDYFPGFIPAWDSDIYSAEDPYFGGQKTRELWVEIAKNTKPTFATLMDQAAEAAMQTAVRSGLNENKTAEEIIADMKSRIENDTRDDYEKMRELMEDAGLL